ncbi:Chromosome transmission fidelity protein 18, partial [Spiromyces aspiralis]
ADPDAPPIGFYSGRGRRGGGGGGGGGGGDRFNATAEDNVGQIAVLDSRDIHDGYIQARKRLRRLEKQQRQPPATTHGGNVPPATVNPSSTVGDGVSCPVPKVNPYTTPPTSGTTFVIGRDSKGTSLYFAKRTNGQIKQDRLRFLQQILQHRGIWSGNNGGALTRINHLVSVTERDLDQKRAASHSVSGINDTRLSVLQDAPAKAKQDANANNSASLWVDKYRPKNFLDLISNDVVNREILRWIKQWDYCVFKRESLAVRNASDAISKQHPDAKGDGRPADRLRRPDKRILLLSGPPGL